MIFWEKVRVKKASTSLKNLYLLIVKRPHRGKNLGKNFFEWEKRKIFLEKEIFWEFGGKWGRFLDIESRAGPQNSRTKNRPVTPPKIFSSIKMLATNRKRFFQSAIWEKNKFYRENGRFIDCCRGFCMGKIFWGTKRPWRIYM